MSNIGTKFILDHRFTFDPNCNSLVDQTSDTETVRLGSNESRILLLLSERPNEVISRNELHEFVWREQGFEVDDSSLTQAISTLRKMLRDSTKSPIFVKTVPKRGYQLICNVERATPLLANDTPVLPEGCDLAELSASTEHEPPAGVSQSEPPPANDIPTQHAAVAPANSSLAGYLMLLLAILLPVGVYLFANPTDTKFSQLLTVNQIPVMALADHPSIKQWLPSIKVCVTKYTEQHQGAESPIKVIATGSQDNELFLNYIHSLSHSNENVTVRIYANQENLAKICK
ncbi:transcriptional regulator [Vibrio profundum]|uniref:winged helix-turn-helix domain-containing protein n=1 Tax=Vibrio profundum TaxID=2910247 RepID=UPI003D0D7B87